jgi:hypothetical protein
MKKHVKRLRGRTSVDKSNAAVRPMHIPRTGHAHGYIRYVVVHSTMTKPDMLLSELETLPYHYIISRAGRVLNLKPVTSKNGTIEIALVSGLDKDGNRVDNRTERQNETLFNKLVRLSERYPVAKIVPADKLYVYPFANPGFDLQAWIADYVPEFLRAA